ncbi:ester cyclase [Gymnodinialimonas sp. 2305UL16-5]|uniref:ester cyclase n=1 Tax=Gymnodinialimonas mytili TaxID=3126503 RepID=UPI00309E4B84
MQDLGIEKRRVWDHLTDLAAGGDVAAAFAPDALAQIAHPYGRCAGPAEIAPLYTDIRAALPDANWRAEIFIAGENHSDPRVQVTRYSPLVASLGHWQGTFAAPLWGIPPTFGAVHLRVCEVHHLNAAGQIAQSWILPDILDLAHQAGVFPLPPMLGAPGLWPGPSGGGVRLDITDAERGRDSLNRVLDMHHALHAFDGVRIESMPMHHWAPGFMYYAAAGIGTSRGLDGFRAHHQIPFLRAFPDRRGAGHFVRIGDGDFALTGGRVTASHLGEYLGMAPTGRQVAIDVMDFYRFDANGLIAENWLPFDIVGLANQMGVDLLARIAHLAGAPRRAL